MGDTESGSWGSRELGGYIRREEARKMEPIVRPDYLLKLLAEVESMDEECFPPNDDVKEGEKIIDALHPYERKLYATGQLVGRNVEEKMLQMRYSLEEREDHANHKFVNDNNDKRELCFKLLWAIVADRLPHYCGQTLGVRRGWHVVIFPRKHGGILNLGDLRDLLGGGDE